MKFEELINKLREMNKEEKNKSLKISDFGASQSKIAKVIEDLRKSCICHACPTYTNCTRKSKELLFCITGKTRCPINERICLCPQDCDVYKKYGLKLSFYCSRGEEIERLDELYMIRI